MTDLQWLGLAIGIPLATEALVWGVGLLILRLWLLWEARRLYRGNI